MRVKKEMGGPVGSAMKEEDGRFLILPAPNKIAAVASASGLWQSLI